MHLQLSVPVEMDTKCELGLASGPWLQVLLLPLISAVLQPPPRLLIVGAHLTVYHTSIVSHFYHHPPVCIYIYIYILFWILFLPPGTLHSSLFTVRHTAVPFSQLSLSLSLLLSLLSSYPSDMNTRPPIATTNRLQALSVTFNQDYSCFSVGLDNGFCGALILKRPFLVAGLTLTPHV